mgnify:CR=1 FL=1
MERLILHPTDTSQWHALVNEAQASTNIVLQEGTESYLVFLLMRFGNNAYLIESIVALDFLNASHRPQQQKIHLLKEVGDKSLLFCGLFPGMAEKRRVSLNYFINMGQSAYLTVSEHQGPKQGALFYQLGQQFNELSTVLKAMRRDVCLLFQKHTSLKPGVQ